MVNSTCMWVVVEIFSDSAGLDPELQAVRGITELQSPYWLFLSLAGC